jgi:hypothetical protein
MTPARLDEEFAESLKRIVPPGLHLTAAEMTLLRTMFYTGMHTPNGKQYQMPEDVLRSVVTALDRTPPPKPKPTYRWYTFEEGCRLVPTHGSILVRLGNTIDSGCISLQDDSRAKVYFFTASMPNVDATNFTEYEKSLDGGQTWQPFGVEVQS